MPEKSLSGITYYKEKSSDVYFEKSMGFCLGGIRLQGSYENFLHFFLWATTPRLIHNIVSSLIFVPKLQYSQERGILFRNSIPEHLTFS